ncbi:MAG TPA: aromatic ring-hydroxylating dioxygenase subunit alpha [Candidatus Hodarchaeales archaeon]|nr:aromatic ring-hydroxylating dioxygenase subunit alpha [Candidatus Hodarchaeales archaeon]
MIPLDIFIDEDISRASTLPATVYRDQEIYLSIVELLQRTWQLVTDTSQVGVPGQVFPFVFLEGSVNEPLLLTRDESDNINCLSNVCTHRGMILVEHSAIEKALRCRYHGRRFDLNGRFQFMPEFEMVKNFPSETDNLPRIPFKLWKQFICVSATRTPLYSFDTLINEMDRRVGWLPIEDFTFNSSRSHEYSVNANWAFYIDNYLEGFHIPYVHSSLSETLEYGSYTTELFEISSLQLGIAKAGELAFELPKSSPDHGKEVAAYYFWLFPNLMFNFYPWGLSINVVRPMSHNRTKVAFLTYVWKPELIDYGAGAGLDRVEREDEAIVESVQKGVQSRFYSRGRYSVQRETGVHHFHSLLGKFLKDGAGE